MRPPHFTPSLSPAYARHLMAYLRSQGIDPARLYGDDAVARYASAELTQRHPVQEWDDMVAMAEMYTSDGALLLKLAEHLKPWDVGALGFLTMTCSNLRQAFDALAMFFNVLNDAYLIQGVLEPDCFRIELTPTSPRRFARLEVYTLGLIAWHARWLARRPRLAFEARLVGPPPLSHATRMALEATFFTTATFGSDGGRLIGPVHYAELPVSQSDSGVGDVLRVELQARMAMLHSHSQLFVHQVERLIQARLDNGLITLDDIAHEMGVPPRTLQGRLQQAGTTFRSLLDRCRHAQALLLVADPGMPITHVSDMLGFTSQSSFHHAFKRWTGLAPSDYRKQKLKLGTANAMDSRYRG